MLILCITIIYHYIYILYLEYLYTCNIYTLYIVNSAP